MDISAFDLGYEQLKVLQIMRDTSDLEASIIAKKQIVLGTNYLIYLKWD